LCSRIDWWNLEHFLARRELAQINKVLEMRKFTLSCKTVISRLPLSFWIAFLTKRYHHKVWVRLEEAEGLRKGGSRETVQRIANEILALRNLIAHQKYILGRDLLRDHQYLHELTTVLDPQLAQEVQKRSRVLDLILNTRLVSSGGGI
jgi:hypothetical protein